MRLFFTYLGGKYRAARLYPEPRHNLIVEPFAGSAGFAIQHHEHDVILVERDERIAGIWRYLLTVDPDEVRELPLVGQGWRTTDDLTGYPPGARDLIGMWLSKATTSPRKTPSRGVVTHPEASYWNARIRERIAVQVPLIRHWRLIQGDYTLAPDVEASWFIDPPYVMAGHQYRYGPDRIDFSELAAWCRSRQGQVTVCEGPHATWLPFRHLANTKGQRSGVDEYIWTREA